MPVSHAFGPPVTGCCGSQKQLPIANTTFGINSRLLTSFIYGKKWRKKNHIWLMKQGIVQFHSSLKSSLCNTIILGNPLNYSRESALQLRSDCFLWYLLWCKEAKWWKWEKKRNHNSFGSFFVTYLGHRAADSMSTPTVCMSEYLNVVSVSLPVRLVFFWLLNLTNSELDEMETRLWCIFFKWTRSIGNVVLFNVL